MRKRVEAVKSILPPHAELAVDANCKFDRDEALAYAKMLAPFKLRWFEEPCDPLDFALLAEIAGVYDGPLSTGENLFSTAGRREPGALRRPQARAPRRDPGRSAAGLRHRAIRAHARHARAPSLAAQPAVPARRQPDVAARSPAASASAARNPIPACSAISAASPTTRGSRTASSRCPTGPASASRGRPRSIASCANWWEARKGTRIAAKTSARCLPADGNSRSS